MRRVIDEINNGHIIRNFGTLTFGVSKVEHTIRTGTTCEGSFAINAKPGQLTEGYVYSSDYRMECLNNRFGGNLDEVAYRFHGEHMLEESEVCGDFILVTNCGEYKIPFIIHIETGMMDSSVGPIRNLFHFTNLAKTRWEEALKLFYQPGFESLFSGEDREYLAAFRCLSGVKDSGHNMDELLITMHKKTPVEYIPSQKYIELNDPEGLSRYSLDITRNGWGHTYFVAESEGDFITLEAERVNFDSFLGNKYQLYYYIDADKLHNGHNFGSIMIKADRTYTVIPVTVNMTGSMQYLRNMTRFRHEHIVRLMKSYSDYRLRKIPSKAWLEESNRIVEEMLDHDPEDLMAGLYRIHLMITQEHLNEAAWNLKAISNRVNDVKSEYTYLWCYYLYLKSLTDEDALDIESLTEEVEFYYKQDPDSWRLCWLLSVMSEEYQNASRRWEMFKEAFRRGCNSPAVYVEAGRIALDNPTIIRSFDDFNMAVIRYLSKQDALKGDIVFEIMEIAQRQKDLTPAHIRILEHCYANQADDELLGVICLNLIKQNRTDGHAHKWYGLGVERSVKITRLFEYYMMSMDKNPDAIIPRPVLLYFSFQSDLDFETNSYLYSYIIRHKDEDSDMYSRYLRQMREFVKDQLKAGHNNRYLALIYRDILDSEMLNDEETAAGLANVIFIHEIDATRHPKARRVVLCYDHSDKEEKYNLKNGLAYIPIYAEDHCVAIEDEFGNRLLGTADVKEHRLISPGKLLLNLRLLVKDHTGIDVNYCLEHPGVCEIRPENEFRYLSLLKKNYFSQGYAANIRMQLIRFYYDREKFTELDALLEKLESRDIGVRDRHECIRYLVKRGQYSKAIEWLYEFGPDGVDKSLIGDLLYSWLPVFKDSADKYEELICQLLTDSLDEGNMSATGVEFLIGHLNSSVNMLKKVWLKAGELEVNRKELDEHIIMQILYTGAYIREKADILKDYAYSSPDREIIGACLNAAAYVYYMEGEDNFERIAGVITDAYETGLTLGKISDMAYAKYFSVNKTLIDDRVREVLKDALHRLLADGVCLPCFKDLSDFMPSMAPYADSVVVEQKDEPGKKLKIHYLLETDGEDYNEDYMNEIYDGLYVRMFVLFFGETLDYYITGENEDKEEVMVKNDKITRYDSMSGTATGRFGLIDEMCMNRAIRDFEGVDSLLEEYYRKSFLTDSLFTVSKG